MIKKVKDLTYADLVNIGEYCRNCDDCDNCKVLGRDLCDDLFRKDSPCMFDKDLSNEVIETEINLDFINKEETMKECYSCDHYCEKKNEGIEDQEPCEMKCCEIQVPSREWYEDELARLREENMDLKKLLKLALDKVRG